MSTVLPLPLAAAEPGPTQDVRGLHARLASAAAYVLSHVPFTRRFNVRIAREVEARAQLLGRLPALAALEPPARRELEARVRRAERRLAHLSLRRRTFITAMVAASAAYLVFYYLAILPGDTVQETTRLLFDNQPALAVGAPGAQGEGQNSVRNLLLLLGAAGVVLRVARRFWLRQVSRATVRRISFAAVAVIYLVWLLSGAGDDVLRYLAVMLLWGVVLSVVGFATIAWVVTLADRWYRRRAAAAYPDAVIVHELLDVLAEVDGHPERWDNLRARGRLLESLERVAQCLERGLPRHLRGRDAATEGWMRERMAERAAAFRALKRWVCLPRLDTREHFVERVVRDLLLAARGDWDGLESAPAESTPAPALRRRVGRALAAAAVLALVLATVYAAAQLFESHPDLREQLNPLLSPLGPLSPILGPLVVYLVARLLHPTLLADLPYLKQITELLPSKRAE